MPQKSTCFHLPRGKLTSVHYHIQFFNLSSRDQTQVLRLARQALTDWATFPALSEPPLVNIMKSHVLAVLWLFLQSLVRYSEHTHLASNEKHTIAGAEKVKQVAGQPWPPETLLGFLSIMKHSDRENGKDYKSETMYIQLWMFNSFRL